MTCIHFTLGGNVSYLVRRSLVLRAFAFVTLLAASDLLAQVVIIGDLCSEYCHWVGTDTYNRVIEGGGSEADALSAGADAMAWCQEEGLCR